MLRDRSRVRRIFMVGRMRGRVWDMNELSAGVKEPKTSERCCKVKFSAIEGISVVSVEVFKRKASVNLRHFRSLHVLIKLHRDIKSMG